MTVLVISIVKISSFLSNEDRFSQHGLLVYHTRTSLTPVLNNMTRRKKLSDDKTIEITFVNIDTHT